jgi:hypothetical protein
MNWKRANLVIPGIILTIHGLNEPMNLISGIYGIFAEETGQVFLRIFTVPVFGLLYAIIITFVYGIFPMLAYMLNENRFSGLDISTIKRYSLAFAALFIQYIIYGFVLPVLKLI